MYFAAHRFSVPFATELHLHSSCGLRRRLQRELELGKGHTPAFPILRKRLQADLKLGRAFELLRPHHAKLHFSLAVKNRDFVEQSHLAANRAQTQSIGRYVERNGEIFEAIPGIVFAFDSDGKHGLGAASTAIIDSWTARTHQFHPQLVCNESARM
jgi:hypothetical protein